MTAPMPAIWYFDVISPYAYLALHRLQRIQSRVAVIPRPVVFGAMLKHWGQLGPAEITPKRVHTYRHVAFLAERMGVPFRFPPAHPFRSLEMQRLIVALGEDWEATRQAFEAVWAAGSDGTDATVLARVAAASGDPGAAHRIGDDAVRQKLAANTAEAIAAGVFGVPTLALDGEIFWGLDALDMAEAYIADPVVFRRGAAAAIDMLPVGVNRQK